jgi:transposase-like protein
MIRHSYTLSDANCGQKSALSISGRAVASAFRCDLCVQVSPAFVDRVIQTSQRQSRDDSPDTFFTTSELADELGVTRATILRWRKQGIVSGTPSVEGWEFSDAERRTLIAHHRKQQNRPHPRSPEGRRLRHQRLREQQVVAW